MVLPRLRPLAFGIALAGVLLLSACGGGDGDDQPPTQPPADPGGSSQRPTPTPVPREALSFTSSAFKDGESIPGKYTCDGANVSPPLRWEKAPKGTESFVLIVTDPDAPREGGFVHWVVFNIPADVTSLDEGASPAGKLPDGAFQGNHTARRAVYTGPCPPAGTPHRYVFRLYAVNASFDLREGASREDVVAALDRTIVLGEATLTGRYGRN